MLQGISRIAGSAGAVTMSAISTASTALNQRAKKVLLDESRLSKPFAEGYDFCDDDDDVDIRMPSQVEVDAVTQELEETINENNEHTQESARAVEKFAHDNDDDDDDDDDVDIRMPSQVEVDAVTQELQETISENHRNENNEHTQESSRAVEKFALGSSAVSQCMELFQRDPAVQAAVVSLARDPAVWDAFVRNEKVQELMRRKNSRQAPLNGTKTLPLTEDYRLSLELLEKETNPFLVAMNCLRSTVWEVVDSIVEVVHKVFGIVDRKLFGERESDPLDRPLKACMVLTILLFALVVLKRAS